MAPSPKNPALPSVRESTRSTRSKTISSSKSSSISVQIIRDEDSANDIADIKTKTAKNVPSTIPIESDSESPSASNNADTSSFRRTRTRGNVSSTSNAVQVTSSEVAAAVPRRTRSSGTKILVSPSPVMSSDSTSLNVNARIDDNSVSNDEKEVNKSGTKKSAKTDDPLLESSSPSTSPYFAKESITASEKLLSQSKKRPNRSLEFSENIDQTKFSKKIKSDKSNPVEQNRTIKNGRDKKDNSIKIKKHDDVTHEISQLVDVNESNTEDDEMLISLTPLNPNSLSSQKKNTYQKAKAVAGTVKSTATDKKTKNEIRNEFVSANAVVVIDDDDNIDEEDEDDDDVLDKPYTVELAATGRATCRTCDEIIVKGILRVSHVPLFRGKPGYRVYRHLKCSIFSEDIQSIHDVGGYRRLKKGDQKILQDRIEESKLLIKKEQEELQPDELVQTEFQGEIRSTPPGLSISAKLLPFQVEGISWMYHQEKHVSSIRGGILADEMGKFD